MAGSAVAISSAVTQWTVKQTDKQGRMLGDTQTHRHTDGRDAGRSALNLQDVDERFEQSSFKNTWKQN